MGVWKRLTYLPSFPLFVFKFGRLGHMYSMARRFWAFHSWLSTEPDFSVDTSRHVSPYMDPSIYIIKYPISWNNMKRYFESCFDRD